MKSERVLEQSLASGVQGSFAASRNVCGTNGGSRQSACQQKLECGGGSNLSSGYGHDAGGGV